MAKKNNKPTFADRAKQIIKSYKRSDFDKIEKDQLDRELAALAQEQEQYRQDNGIDQEQSQQPQIAPNQQQFANGSFLDYLNADYEEPNIAVEPWMTDPSAFMNSLQLQPRGLNTNFNIDTSKLLSTAPPLAYQQNMTSTNRGMLPTTGLSNYSTSIVPSIASGAITAGANMFMANRATKDIPELELGRIRPEEVSLSRERAGVRRQSGLASRIARANAAKSSRTRGEYLSNAAAQSAAMNRGTLEALSQLYSQEARMNAAERARASQTNAQMQAREAAANMQAQQRARANRDAYTSAAIQAIPQTMQNIAGIRQQDALINSLGQDYSMAQYQDPSLNWFQRLTQPKQTVRQYNNRD